MSVAVYMMSEYAKRNNIKDGALLERKKLVSFYLAEKKCSLNSAREFVRTLIILEILTENSDDALKFNEARMRELQRS